MSLNADQFIKFLQLFYEDNEEVLVFDHMKEFDKELDKDFKAETDANFDPFRDKIEDTLQNYREILEKDDFDNPM